MLISWLSAIIAVCIFIGLFLLLKIIQNSFSVFSVVSQTALILFNHKISDQDKEAAFKRNALKLLKLFLLITLAGGISLAVPTACIYAGHQLNLLDYQDVLAVSVSWPFLLSSSVAGFGIYLVLRPKQTLSTESGFENSYSQTEEKLHRIAFNSWSVQKVFSSIEDWLFRSRLKNIAIDRPVFVTALPRAGTTLLLEIYSNADDFVTHSYRDMPFLMSPLFWDKFSKNFQTEQQEVERAHGDGMKVNVDSAEAFEEVIWNYFWFKRYHQSSISPWKMNANPEFEVFFDKHIRKIISLRGKNTNNKARYISKNNLNIARLDYLKSLYPESIIVVPFREPIQHALSLLRQHRNFLKIHQDDSFAKEYMEAIGHYDFGENLKPVNFDRWLKDTEYTDTESLNFWLAYWIATYQHILTHQAKHIHLLSYEDLCDSPKQGLACLGDTIGIKNSQSFLSQAERIKTPRKHTYPDTDVAKNLEAQAKHLFSQLREKSIYRSSTFQA